MNDVTPPPFRHVDTCSEHGFALDPDGRCVRCTREAVAAIRGAVWRRRLLSAVALVGVLVSVAAWGRVRSRGGAAADSTVTGEPVGGGVDPAGTVAERPVTFVATVPGSLPGTFPQAPGRGRAAAAQAPRSVLTAWDLELARAEARRSAELAAEAAARAAADRRRDEEALVAAAAAARAEGGQHRSGRSESLPSSVDHPSWWQDNQPVPGRMRASLSAQKRAMAAAGVAPYDVTNPSAWLPPNNGGNFTNRSPSR
jgi:hypothetical protein